MPIESIIGFLIIAFMVLTMTRKLALLVIPKMAVGQPGKAATTLIKILTWISKFHRLFGITTLLLALFHATLIFAKTGSFSLTGMVLVAVLIVQVLSGYLREKRIGNPQIVSYLHKIIPFVAVTLVIAHIIFNGVGY